MKKSLYILIVFILCCPIIINAEEITNRCNILVNENRYDDLLDNNYLTFEEFNLNDKISISCEENIAYIYLKYKDSPIIGKVNNSIDIGNNGYLHELIPLEETINAEITYNDNYSITDIYIFNDEPLPDWVENWQTLSKADLLLVSAHSDDEHLFFAGILPTYLDRDYKIEVIYFTRHYENYSRVHELLEGLWTVGLKYYPVISTFPDEYSTSLEEALNNFKSHELAEDDGINFFIKNIRKFKPDVVVGHDENGEYGHGQHSLSTYFLEKAIQKARDSKYDLEGLGPWSIKKMYIHLYSQNEITLDLDTPLKSYNGKTAFEVSKEGYLKHVSQQYTWFTDWLNEFENAKDIEKYSPTKYGLYYTAVGNDVDKNDIFENIKKSIETLAHKDIKEKVIKKLDKKDNNMSSEKLYIKIIYLITGIILCYVMIKIVTNLN